MDLWATKDRYERETEEAERLVRPAPKVKAPRKDLRREEMRPDRDPDIDDDPDIAKDKDLSLNYKNIGGSVVGRVVARYVYGHDPIALRVAARFVRGDLDREELVSVKRKDDGKVVHVSPDTLKGPEAAKYEKLDEGEEEKPSKEENAAKVNELAEKNPRLKSVLDTLADPKHKEHQTLTSLSELPLNRMFKDVEFPKGVETVGDLQEIAQAKAAEPKKKPKKEPKPKAKPEEPPKAPEPPKTEAPKEEKAPEPAKEAPKEEPKKEEAPVAAPAGPPPGALPDQPAQPKPTAAPGEPAGPAPEQLKALQSWKDEGGPGGEEFKQWAGKQKKVTEKDGKLLFRTKGKGLVSLEELSPADQLAVKDKFESDVKSERNHAAIQEFAKDPKNHKLLKELANPESPLREKIEEEARSDQRDLDESDPAKTIPELAHLQLPTSMSSAQDLISAAEKAFAPPAEPKRPKPSKQEQTRAEAAVEETLPEEDAQLVSGMDLHPAQVNDLISGYKAALRGDASHEDLLSSAGYHMDPETVEPPEHVMVDGVRTPFESLTPEEQSETFSRWKMHVLATSMAAKTRLQNTFAKTGLPGDMAKIIAETSLKHRADLPDEHVQEFFKTALASSMEHSKPLKPDQVKSILEKVKDNPAATKLLGAYVQASNYAEARDRFLSTDPLDRQRITEHDDPKKIAKKLEQASKFLEEKSKELPVEARVVDPAMEFRNRVIDRMTYLDPMKVSAIRGYLADYENHDYEAKEKEAKTLDKAFKKAVEKERKARDKEHRETFKDMPYREMEEPEEVELADIEKRLAKKGVHPPRFPSKPPGYDDWKERKKMTESVRDSFSFLRNLFKRKPKAASLTVEERVVLRTLLPTVRQRLAFRAASGLLGGSISSYPGCWTMGQTSPGVRTAVYWGQQPYEQTAPYPESTQLQARDFSDADFDNILKAAREWMKLPVLGRPIKGLYPDTQFRAALDLALRDLDGGKYSVGLYPTVYNELLARLSGRAGPYELLTGKPDDVPEAGVKQAGKSTYGATTERGSTTMKASAQVRQFASRAASATPDPELAFDLMQLADRLAQDEAQAGQAQSGQEQAPPAEQEAQKQAAIRVAASHVNKFNAVKALVVKQATAYPTLREVFIPILQALKG